MEEGGVMVYGGRWCGGVWRKVVWWCNGEVVAMRFCNCSFPL